MFDAAVLIARFVLAGVFVASAVTKLADRDASTQALINFGVSASLGFPLALALTCTELIIAISLIPSISSWWGGLGALALLLVFSTGIAFNLNSGRRPVCRCFGLLSSKPIGWPTLGRNALLAALAGLIVLQPWIPPYFMQPGSLEDIRVSGSAVLFAGIGFVVIVMLVVESWLIILLFNRLRALELKVTEASSPSPAPVPNGFGLPVGAPAPAFGLTSLDGGQVTLDSLIRLSKPVVLVFTDPGCAPCKDVLPDLAHWQRQRAAPLTVVNISHGPLDANRALSTKYGLGTVLVQVDEEVTHAYRAFGTPSAILIMPDGTVGSALALGEQEIRALVQGRLQSVTRVQSAKRTKLPVGNQLGMGSSEN